jgi:hypothetical protein
LLGLHEGRREGGWLGSDDSGSDDGCAVHGPFLRVGCSVDWGSNAAFEVGCSVGWEWPVDGASASVAARVNNKAIKLED